MIYTQFDGETEEERLKRIAGDLEMLRIRNPDCSFFVRFTFGPEDDKNVYKWMAFGNTQEEQDFECALDINKVLDDFGVAVYGVNAAIDRMRQDINGTPCDCACYYDNIIYMARILQTQIARCLIAIEKRREEEGKE